MNWRKTQLGYDLCDQDRVILNLIGQRPVRIHGQDAGFAQFCTVDPGSSFCLVFFNQPVWLSQIRDLLRRDLTSEITHCYIGINRYRILGNDIVQDILPKNPSSSHGQNLIAVISLWLEDLNLQVKQTGAMDQDRGKYFNFVQPLTWIYCERETLSAH